MSKKLRIGLPFNSKEDSCFLRRAENRKYWSYRIMREFGDVALWNTRDKENPVYVASSLKIVRYVKKTSYAKENNHQ